MTRRGLVAVGAALTLLVACSGDDDGGSAASESSTTTPSTESAGEPLQLGEHDAVDIEMTYPDWLAADDEFLYVKLDGGEINRVDPDAGAVVDSAVIEGESGVSGTGCQGLGVGFDSVWTCYGADVVRFDLDSFTEVSRIKAEKTATQGHLATGFDRVWVLQGDGSALASIDPETEAVSKPIKLPVRGTDLAVGDDGIWVVGALDDAVLLVDPADGTVRHRITDIEGPAALSVVDDAVWVGGIDAVHRIDPVDGSIIETIEGGSDVVAADETGVWIRDDLDIRHVESPSGEETSSFTLDLDGPSPGDMLVAFDALWTTASEHSSLFRIDIE